MAQQVRIGFVGAGGIATEAHIPALKQIEGVEIVALCDTRKEQADAAAQQFGGRAYSDHREMLDREEMDGLFVCVPPGAHTDAELIAAGRGVHLFIEKPVVLTMDKGLEIAEAVKKANVISCVGYQVRYFPVAEAARTFLADKTIGMVVGNRWGGIPGGPEHWWRVMDQSGGMVHEMATHNIDLIRYLVGDFAAVYACYSRNVLKDVDNLTVPDAQVIVMQFENGAAGSFSATCALTKGGGASSTDIVLRDVMLRISFSEIEVMPEGAADITLPEPGMNIQETFIHAIRTGDRSVIRSDYFDALKTAEVTLGANKSAATGKPVTMTLA
ncbi:MAG: Gfo/Idh/MocA family oxidoreductase [Armatimonadota bacterium]|nr:MAG: Gfo/Idh/MocA family oxidoreductase [Armatimonadota bacterium]